jgi:hypothetical protein
MRAPAIACLSAAFGAAALLSGALSAARAGDPPAADRYELKSVAGGFLRLDRQSGLTSFCAPSGEGYACRPATEAERTAGGAGAPDLDKRLASIEDRLKALEGKGPDAAANRDPTLDLPTEQQIDRVASFFERAMQRLKKIAEEMQKAEGEPDRQRL